MREFISVILASILGFGLIILVYVLPPLLIIGGAALIVKWLFF